MAPLSTLTSRATHAHPTSPRSTGFCAIWGCISSFEFGPSLNSQYGDERESFARKVSRHAMRLREEVLAATAAKTTVGYVAAAQKSAKAEPVSNLE